MLTIDQILENNSDEENDIFIATYGKDQFDELMHLLENKGYKWHEGEKPTAPYGDILNSLGKLFDTNNPYQFADATIIMISLKYSNKEIQCIPLLPDESNAQSHYEYCFNNEEDMKLIKPYILLKKEIEQAVDWEE